VTLAVVAIGRNEGERLRRCLSSVLPHAATVIYVDSGSSDGSVALAEQLGALVVNLDLSQPFTAARARNAGLQRLRSVAPQAQYVQFVDGDCEVVDGWLPLAQAFLDAHPKAAAVCGRRRERHPERSIYNLLCDLEWDTPIGRTKACGGDVLMRVTAVVQAGGYRDGLIAGEEPELCVRLRAAGWEIWRAEAEMTLHDAAMTRFPQWWTRTTRAGFAFAEGARLHGAPPERHWVRETRSALLWGFLLPLSLLLLAIVFGPRALALFAIYPLQVLRLFLRQPGSLKVRLLRSTFLVIGKFAEASGCLRYALRRLRQDPARLIEYK
jgi:hypothetical protein